MNKIAIIIKREFLTRVRKKSFILITLFMPLLIVAVIAVPLALSRIEDNDTHLVAVVDETGHYVKSGAFTDAGNYVFVPLEKMDEGMKSPESDYEAVVNIRGDLSQKPDDVSIYSNKEVSVILLDLVTGRLDKTVKDDKLKATNIDGIENILADLDRGVKVNTIKWNEKGEEKESSTHLAIIVGMIFTILIYMFVTIYGMMVMQSVIEEKANRIVEIMVSSVKPFQLLMGKIVGIALVGITQLLIWFGLCLGIFFIMGQFIAGDAAKVAAAGQIPEGMDNIPAGALDTISQLPLGEIAIMFVVMFIGGYLFYASFLAAIGASINEQEDAQQFTTPIMFIMMFALYAAIYSAKNASGPLAFWGSMFPLTSPVVMMVRIPFGVPLWEELLSIALLYLSAIFMVWIGAKIYRVGILIYGKKPSLKEMWKWLTFK